MEQPLRQVTIIERIVRGFLMLCVFIILAGAVFFGVKWFSDSVEGFFFDGQKENSVFSANLEASASNVIEVVRPIDDNLLPLRDWRVEQIQIEAAAAISVEEGSGPDKILFAKNGEKKLPIASLTKLMTALIVLEKYGLNNEIEINSATMLQEGEQGELLAGQVLTVKNLLYIMLIESSNRAAYAIADAIGTENFVYLMNEKAEKLELKNTHFTDSTGLDAASYSTAGDLAKLSKHVFEQYPLFREIIGLKEFDLYLNDGSFHHKLVSTNKFLGEVAGVLGGKTGWTQIARGCFMIIEQSPKKGNYLTHIVLGAEDRFLEMQKMMDWVQMAYEWK